MATVPGALVAQLRRLTAEPIDTSPYSDVDLIEAIERYPLPDTAGAAPDDTAWTGAWDIYQAAADICDEKAATVAANFDFAADGGDYKRSQAYAQLAQLARRYRARRRTGTVTMVAEPPPAGAVLTDGWLGNAPETP